VKIVIYSEFENHEVKPRLITIPTVINAFEAIWKVIKRLGEITSINYYEAVKMAYLESKEPRLIHSEKSI